MTGQDRRLVALAAALAPARAAQLLARLGGPAAAQAQRAAEALAVEPRRTRLAALASSLAEDPTPATRDAPPLLRRLELERRIAGTVAQTPVRGTAAGPAASRGIRPHLARHAT